MEDYAHLSPLEPSECEVLVRSRAFGRVAWQSSTGLQILPVAYVVADGVIVFRTAVGSQLARLVEPTDVAFQVDDLDMETRVGWSVLAQGRTAPFSASQTRELPSPWAPGDRPILIGIHPSAYTGRSVYASWTKWEK
ncbi:MAG: pyridoxamine 5'-phosphate oxidase family protein [Micropruina sp.]|nr:pyridoxamine 5'-phosphate oxidase family protein [Micropruina sp.]